MLERPGGQATSVNAPIRLRWNAGTGPTRAGDTGPRPRMGSASRAAFGFGASSRNSARRGAARLAQHERARRRNVEVRDDEELERQVGGGFVHFSDAPGGVETLHVAAHHAAAEDLVLAFGLRRVEAND